MYLITQLNRRHSIWIVFGIGFLARFLLLLTPGSSMDVYWWQNWVLKIKEVGLASIYQPEWTGISFGQSPAVLDVNYLPGILYYLALVAQLPTVFLQPLTPYFTFLIKLPNLVFDVLMLGMLLRILKLLNVSFRTTNFISTAFWLNPTLIINNALRGLGDTIIGFFLFVSVYFLLQKKGALALCAIAVAILFKLQAIFYVPVLFFFLILKKDWKGILYGTLLSIMAGCIIFLPFIISKNLITALSIPFKLVGYYSVPTSFALNIWHPFAALFNFNVSDQIDLWNGITPRLLGIAAFGLATLFNLFFLQKKKEDPFTLFFSLTTQAFSAFLLLTEMHEKYLFYTFPPLMLLLALHSRRIFLWYSAISISFFANLYLYIAYTHGAYLFLTGNDFIFHIWWILNSILYILLWKYYAKRINSPTDV